MVIGQRRAVRLLVCNVTRLHVGMSRTDAQNAPSLFVPELKTLHYPTSLPFGEEVEIFSLYGCEKILPLARLPGQVMFGRLHSIRRWAGNLFVSTPIPSRPSPWLRISRPNMFCPGRQGEMELVRQPSFVHNRQLTIDFAPVMDLHRPLFRSSKLGQI